MCLIKSKKQRYVPKHLQKTVMKDKHRSKQKSYLLEDPSIKHEAHSRWEAEDIYDEDDFCDK